MKRAQCPYSELFWSAFSRIQTEHGEILRISPYSVQIQENADQNNSEYGHFSRSARELSYTFLFWEMTGSEFSASYTVFYFHFEIQPVVNVFFISGNLSSHKFICALGRHDNYSVLEQLEKILEGICIFLLLYVW